MAGLSKINRFVVLMLENRSFDHMLGYTKKVNPAIDGMADTAFNYEDPVRKKRKVLVSRATSSALPYDPSHEFAEVQIQLYGPNASGTSNPAVKMAPMSGFIRSSAVPGGKRANEVMHCFEADQLPVFTTLASQFGVVNYWYSSMPGPTWPNRFFVHAATSGGLTESPSMSEVIRGFSFESGTIYDRLVAAKLGWRIYHTDMPQAIGIRKLRTHYIRGSHFRQFEHFKDDVANGNLPEYTFIEPHYDVFNDFGEGNSMHPHNDVVRGEKLVKEVYESIRSSPLWIDTMLIITFDEHGGFYDHISPPPAVSTGNDIKYATKGRQFKFDRYGIRVPTIVISPYTAAGTVIGEKSDDRRDIFDHCSILATLEKRFELAPLTKRDKKANSLEALLNLELPREDAPKKLPTVRLSRKRSSPKSSQRRNLRAETQPLNKMQEAVLGLAIACDREMRNASGTPGIAKLSAAPKSRHAAAVYTDEVQARILARRVKGRNKGKPK